jgi:nucleoside permease NupC
MDRVLHFVLALVVVTALALLVSTDRKKFVFVMLSNCWSLKFYLRGSS